MTETEDEILLSSSPSARQAYLDRIILDRSRIPPPPVKIFRDGMMLPASALRTAKIIDLIPFLKRRKR